MQDVTKFKTSAEWGSERMKAVETKVKAAFTRSFNKAGLPTKTTIMVEDGKKGKGRTAAPAAAVADEDEALGGELADVRTIPCLPFDVAFEWDTIRSVV